jgi:hypothetical protein
MKPTSPVQNRPRDTNLRFPITDCNYRPLGFPEVKARCAGAPRSSLAKISQNYFNGEARRNFVTETVLFTLIALATVPAFLDCARALLAFLRAIGAT